MDSRIKINQLTAETQLSPTHLFVVQDGSINESETKKATLSLLRTWLGGLNFEDLTKILNAGDDISLEIDEETKIIKINSTVIATQWFVGKQPENAKTGDFWLNETGEVYQYNEADWVAANVNLTGPSGIDGVNGQDGFSPIITAISNENGYTIKIKDASHEESINIINGITPYIDEDTMCWVIGGINTGIIAKGENGADGKDGLSPSAKVEYTENGYVITVNDGEETKVEIKTPTIEFGTIETIPAGQEPVIENIGDNINAVLNLKIPKGQDGGGTILVQGPYELLAENWSGKRQFIEIPLDLLNRNVIDVDYTETSIWANYVIRPVKETETGISFSCLTHPPYDLHFYITSMGVNN